MKDIHERSFEFACRIVHVHRELTRKRGTDRAIATQLLRSGTSIGANLEEAKAGQSRADFIAKARIALKEARESHYWLRVIEATHILPPHRVHDLVSEANEIVAILTTIIKRASTPKSLQSTRPPFLNSSFCALRSAFKLLATPSLCPCKAVEPQRVTPYVM